MSRLIRRYVLSRTLRTLETSIISLFALIATGYGICSALRHHVALIHLEQPDAFRGYTERVTWTTIAVTDDLSFWRI